MVSFRFFRVVPAGEYLATFASDRSHMLKDGKWLKPPPNYPPISTDNSQHNLSAFISMTSQQVPGRIFNCREFISQFSWTWQYICVSIGEALTSRRKNVRTRSMSKMPNDVNFLRWKRLHHNLPRICYSRRRECRVFSGQVDSVCERWENARMAGNPSSECEWWNW